MKTVSIIVISMAVTKMSIGKTDKDEREESSGLNTKLAFDVVGSPRNLARMANLLKQGNVNISLEIKATNAATDVSVESIELPHQMGLGEEPVPPVSDATLAASMPPVTEVRSGESLVPENGNGNGHDNGDKPGVVIVDLSTFEVKTPDGDGPYTVILDGCRKKSKDLIGSILTVFNSKSVACKGAADLIDTLLLYPQSEKRGLLLEVLQIGKMPERVIGK